METKKKTIIISILVILIIAVIAGVILYFVTSKNVENIDTTSKINTLYETLTSNTAYNVSVTLDNNNQLNYQKQSNVAYINTSYNGVKTKYIIKDGNSYLLMEDTKTYCIYKNNESDLNKIENQISNLKEQKATKGKEKVENQTYEYEEYEGLTNFIIQDMSTISQGQEVKTRFYFDNNNLVYIKTIIGNKQEIFKVNISYDVDSKLFEIPSDYKEI